MASSTECSRLDNSGLSSDLFSSGGLASAIANCLMNVHVCCKGDLLFLPLRLSLATKLAFDCHFGSAGRNMICMLAPSSFSRVDNALRTACIVSRFDSWYVAIGYAN